MASTITAENLVTATHILHTAAQLSERLTHYRQEQDYQADEAFPFQEFEALRKAGLLTVTLPRQALDFRQNHAVELLQLLKLVGKGNLSVGRIYEGHINALYLIHLFGTTEQQNRWHNDAYHTQRLFGVWNTQAQDGITILAQGNGQYLLKGAKTFCSGAQWVTRPIITGQLISETGEDLGWQMVVVPMEQHDLPVDDSFWKPLGMMASVSHKIDFTDVVLEEGDLLGQPDDYHQQPYFSGGAVRFAAVQLGGAEAIYDATRQYLQDLQRTEDPYQRMRLGEMAILIETGNLWIQNVGKLVEHQTNEQIIQYANMTRTAIEKIGLDVMQLSERCVGARGLLYPQPFARLHADLTTYLRQPAPDIALAQVGAYVGQQTLPAHALWSRQS